MEEMKSVLLHVWEEMKSVLLHVWEEMKGVLLHVWEEMKGVLLHVWEELLQEHIDNAIDKFRERCHQVIDEEGGHIKHLR